MPNNIFALDQFLDSLTDSIQVPNYSTRIAKKEIINLLSKFLVLNKINEKPEFIFEEWECLIRHKRLVKSQYCLYFDIFTDEIIIELIPSAETLERIVENYSTTLKPQLVRNISDLDPKQFVRLLENIFNNTKWSRDVHITKWTRDGGVDFTGKYMSGKTPKKTRLIGQAKHWKSKVGPNPVRSFIGTLTLHQKNPFVGVYVCTAGFSTDALREISKAPFKILTFDVVQLADLLIENKIGISAFTLEGSTIDEKFWEEIKE